jgi:hypothetical protein
MNEIRVVEAVANERRKALLGVLGPDAREELQPGGDIAGRSSHLIRSSSAER